MTDRKGSGNRALSFLIFQKGGVRMANVRPLPHQEEAIRKLRSGSILCGGVGTGKSLTALLYFRNVVCKAIQWTDGIERGPLMEPRPLYIITTARKRDTKEWEAECDRFDDLDVPITIDSWNNIHKYESAEGAFFIFDEQRVVGHGSWVRSFIRIARHNDWILLSATPGDTWMDYIPVFVANGFYKNRSQFLRRHAVYNRFSKYPKVDKWLETGYLEMLRRKITVVMSYDKKTVQHWHDIWVDYDRDLYKLVAEQRWNPYEDQPIQDISAACYLMRKVVNIDGRRLEAVREIIREHDRAIIFYNYDYELEQLRNLADERTVAEWNGHVHQRLPSVERWVYLVQYTAGAEGWNCIDTDTIIFYSQSYSYKAMTQAAGRIDRMNTTYTDLHYYILKSKSSIDMGIARALKGKRNFNEKLFMDW